MQNALKAEISKVINFDLEEGQHLVLIGVRTGGESFEQIVHIANTENGFSLDPEKKMISKKLPKPEEVWDELVKFEQAQSNGSQNKRDREAKQKIECEVRKQKEKDPERSESDVKTKVIQEYLDVRKALWNIPTADEVVHDPFRTEDAE